jgi:hypothetical protein
MLVDLNVFYLLYEGEGDGGEGGEGAGEGDSTGTSKEGESKAVGTRTFTQDEVNKMMATDRRKNEERLRSTINELETIKKSKNLTEQEQQSLTKRIEELNEQMLTKEQLAQKDRDKLEKDYKSRVDELSQDRDGWKTRFEQALVVNAIQKASEEHGAFDTEQIIALIQSRNPRVVQETDENGAVKNVFTPRVKIQDTDKQGKDVTLDLTISEAVKRMKDQPGNFNLFKATVNGGLGLNSGTGRSDSDTPPIHDTAAYRKWRLKHLKIGQ